MALATIFRRCSRFAGCKQPVQSRRVDGARADRVNSNSPALEVAKFDKLHAGYFCSYALWGYLTTPFLYTYSGFEVQEIEPWQEDGERWRVLQGHFPDGYAGHTRTQYSYFGEDGLLRRHLYTVDVLGGAQGANYASEYRTVDGVRLATRRRVFAYDDVRQKLPDPVLVSIDLSEIHFE